MTDEADKADKTDKTDKADKANKADKTDIADKADKIELNNTLIKIKQILVYFSKILLYLIFLIEPGSIRKDFVFVHWLRKLQSTGQFGVACYDRQYEVVCFLQ